MGALTIDYITSLEGYGGAEGWPGFWGLAGPEYLEFLGEDSDPTATMLMGANTYRMYVDFMAKGTPGIDGMNPLPKIVFSKSLEEPLDWENTRLISGDAVEAVRELKQGDSRLYTNGSPSLSTSLLKAGLVDWYRVVIFPVATGKSGDARIYDGWPDVVLEDVRTRTFDGSLQLIEGRPRILDKPLPEGPVE